jgi:hypothetical protein
LLYALQVHEDLHATYALNLGFRSHQRSAPKDGMLREKSWEQRPHA